MKDNHPIQFGISGWRGTIAEHFAFLNAALKEAELRQLIGPAKPFVGD
jgi:hypothetical protein